MRIADNTFSQVFDTGEDEQQGEAADAQAQAELEPEDVDAEVADVDKRLAKAACYRAIIQDGVLQDNGSDVTSEVNEENRRWARNMMAILVGKAKPQPQLPGLTAEEVAGLKVLLQLATPEVVATLKQLAARALQYAAAPRPEPAVKRVQVQEQQQQVQKVQPRQPQTMAKRAQPQQPKKPPAPAPKPPQKTQPAAKKAPPAPKGGGDPYEDVPSKQVFEDERDGQLYKWIDNPRYDPAVPGSKVRFKIKVTKQITNNHAKPFPTIHEMQIISQVQAEKTIAAGASSTALGEEYGGGSGTPATTYVHAAAGSLAKRD